MNRLLRVERIENEFAVFEDTWISELDEIMIGDLDIKILEYKIIEEYTYMYLGTHNLTQVHSKVALKTTPELQVGDLVKVKNM